MGRDKYNGKENRRAPCCNTFHDRNAFAFYIPDISLLSDDYTLTHTFLARSLGKSGLWDVASIHNRLHADHILYYDVFRHVYYTRHGDGEYIAFDTKHREGSEDCYVIVHSAGGISNNFGLGGDICSKQFSRCNRYVFKDKRTHYHRSKRAYVRRQLAKGAINHTSDIDSFPYSAGF